MHLQKNTEDKSPRRVKITLVSVVKSEKKPKENSNNMKRFSLAAVGVGCMLFQSAQATLLFSEAFNYNTGNLVGNVNPGSSTWSGTGSTALTIVSGNLTYAGLADQGGNELQIANGAAQSQYITFANQTSGQIYYSFLFNPSELTVAITTSRR